MDEETEIFDNKKKWEDDCYNRALERWPERRKEFVTTSSLPIDKLYTPEDVGDFDYFEKLGYPG